MDDVTNREQAVELLQQLGLKEYEAKCFVALARLPSGTAKQISDISEVPRTRVYDAARVLETKGLIEIQHSSPQRFRAVSIDEAAATLRAEYESRTESLRETLQGIGSVSLEGESEVTHEVWGLSGTTAIANRTQQLIDEADEEVVVVVGNDAVVTDQLIEHLTAAQERGVTVIVGTISEALRETVERSLPDAEVFVSGLEWLAGTAVAGDETEISRLLLVDRSTILISTYGSREVSGERPEQAVFGRGFDNGLVVILRRLMATGLLPIDDPGKESESSESA